MKICVYNFNCVLDEILPELDKRHEFVADVDKADLIIIWNEIEQGGWKKIIEGAHKRGKKVLLYQQGIHGIDRVQFPFNEKLDSDVVCVWGPWDKDHLVKYGTPAEKIHVTGCPFLKRIKPKTAHEGKNVVFALEHWDIEDIPENLIVASKLRELKGVKVITKALIGEHDLDLYDNVLISKRFDPNHLDKVLDLLSVTDVVVAISESTFAYLAEAMDIPVVIADIWIPKTRGGDKRYLDYKHTFTKGVNKVPVEELNKTILWTLKHPEYLREERKTTTIGYGEGNEDIIKIINKC
jgi:hypothetical protein